MMLFKKRMMMVYLTYKDMKTTLMILTMSIGIVSMVIGISRVIIALSLSAKESQI